METVLSLAIRPMKPVLLSAEATLLLNLPSPLVSFPPGIMNSSGERFPQDPDAGRGHPNKLFPSCAPQASHIGIMLPTSLCAPLLRKVF